MDQDDELVTSIPIHYSTTLVPNLQLHQFPLLTRPLQAPPHAVAAGKRITARIKPNTGRLEIHVPVDARAEVTNVERAKQLGAAQMEDDREKNQAKVEKQRDDEEHRLSETRLRSDPVDHKGVAMLGILRDGKLHLHPIDETHQFRPTLTYLDYLSKKNKRSRGGDSDSEDDDNPPPDPDEAPPLIATKKERKASGAAKEVQVAARKTGEQGGIGAHAGMSAARRDMLHLIRLEEEESWVPYSVYDVTTNQSAETFGALFSQTDEPLPCETDMSQFITTIKGL